MLQVAELIYRFVFVINVHSEQRATEQRSYKIENINIPAATDDFLKLRDSITGKGSK